MDVTHRSVAAVTTVRVAVYLQVGPHGADLTTSERHFPVDIIPRMLLCCCLASLEHDMRPWLWSHSLHKRPPSIVVHLHTSAKASFHHARAVVVVVQDVVLLAVVVSKASRLRLLEDLFTRRFTSVEIHQALHDLLHFF